MRIPRLLAGLVVVAGLLLSPLSPAEGVQSPLPGPVADWGTTVGTDGRVYIADDQGRARQFHGANHKTGNPDTLTDQLLTDAAERGLDHIRLAIYWDALEPTEGTFDEAYLDSLVAAMDRAAEHGLLVIVDMHQDVFGPAFGDRGIPAWATRTDGAPFEPQPIWFLNYMQPAVQNAWEHLYEDEDLRQFQIRAWLHVVDRVKDHPALLGYDLLNEPFGKLREGEDLFTAAARVESTQMTPMYQRLTDAISAVDPDHWVFFEPPNLASLGVPTSLGEVTGPKVALYPHMYDSNVETGGYTGGEVSYDPAFFTRWSDAIATYTDKYPIPMMVGEWGLTRPEDPGMDLFVADSLATLDRRTSGWSVFNWCRGDGYCPIDADGNDRDGMGQIFQPYARAIAGAPTSSVWDPATNALVVKYRDNAATGPTEIFLPETRAYPDGWKVLTSAPDGTWTWDFDAETGVLEVDIPDAGTDYAVCVVPAGSTATCAVAQPGPSTTTTTAPLTTTTLYPVRPATTSPRFTG